MFFMIGISDEQKDLDYGRMMVCDACGAYGRYRVYMVCTVLRLFFIPVLKWNRRYFVQASCCESLYSLDGAIGARIAAGEDVEIQTEHLHRMHSGSCDVRRCQNCGFLTREDYDFCPKCGRKF